MTEVLLYCLERQPLERVLPVLIDRTLERGWRAVIQVGSEERVEAISTALWTTGEQSFRPHGTTRDGNADLQPVWITTDSDNPNGARVRFMVDGEFGVDFDGFDRVVFMFDGRDAAARASADGVWQEAKARGHSTTYWRQDETGRWQQSG